MRRNCSSILLPALLAAGCAAPQHPPPQSLPHTGQLFPPDALVTQRGLLTLRGRQFSLNGYVAKSETRGLRLIVTETFGGVVADVLVNRDGRVFVMQSKPPLRSAWLERYIAADLKCIFGEAMETNCPVHVLSSTNFVVERRWYRLDLQTVETKPGPQPAELFDETRGGKP